MKHKTIKSLLEDLVDNEYTIYLCGGQTLHVERPIGAYIIDESSDTLLNIERKGRKTLDIDYTCICAIDI